MAWYGMTNKQEKNDASYNMAGISILNSFSALYWYTYKLAYKPTRAELLLKYFTTEYSLHSKPVIASSPDQDHDISLNPATFCT